MELVAGETLSQRLARGEFPGTTAALQIVAQTADALAAAHLAGVIHRDIKPGNLLLSVGRQRQGERLRRRQGGRRIDRADPHRHDGGEPRLHGAGAGAGHGARRPERPVLARRRALRDADAPQALPRRHADHAGLPDPAPGSVRIGDRGGPPAPGPHRPAALVARQGARRPHPRRGDLRGPRPRAGGAVLPRFDLGADRHGARLRGGSAAAAAERAAAAAAGELRHFGADRDRPPPARGRPGAGSAGCPGSQPASCWPPSSAGSSCASLRRRPIWRRLLPARVRAVAWWPVRSRRRQRGRARERRRGGDAGSRGGSARRAGAAAAGAEAAARDPGRRDARGTGSGARSVGRRDGPGARAGAADRGGLPVPPRRRVQGRSGRGAGHRRRPTARRSRRLGRRGRRQDLLLLRPGRPPGQALAAGLPHRLGEGGRHALRQAGRRRASTPSSKRSIERAGGESDLGRLLAGMRPELQEGTYLFCTVAPTGSPQASLRSRPFARPRASRWC